MPADPRIRFLVDENVPAGVSTFLRDRGHDVFPVGEYLAKGSPDQLLTVAAELEGMVVITFDRDFKRLITQMPHGSRVGLSVVPDVSALRSKSRRHPA
ncbi:MAG TPA: DUF5615 family PIN-like protein, partial [Nitrolancea sp.]